MNTDRHAKLRGYVANPRGLRGLGARSARHSRNEQDAERANAARAARDFAMYGEFDLARRIIRKHHLSPSELMTLGRLNDTKPFSARQKHAVLTCIRRPVTAGRLGEAGVTPAKTTGFSPDGSEGVVSPAGSRHCQPCAEFPHETHPNFNDE